MDENAGVDIAHQAWRPVTAERQPECSGSQLNSRPN